MGTSSGGPVGRNRQSRSCPPPARDDGHQLGRVRAQHRVVQPWNRSSRDRGRRRECSAADRVHAVRPAATPARSHRLAASRTASAPRSEQRQFVRQVAAPRPRRRPGHAGRAPRCERRRPPSRFLGRSQDHERLPLATPIRTASRRAGSLLSSSSGRFAWRKRTAARGRPRGRPGRRHGHDSVPITFRVPPKRSISARSLVW